MAVTVKREESASGLVLDSSSLIFSLKREPAMRVSSGLGHDLVIEKKRLRNKVCRKIQNYNSQ